MSNFTPEQIQEILSLYFENFAHRQYIGARYVPIFGRKGETSIEWDNSAPYEPLTIVLHEGNSYTSRQFVPTGVAITNSAYWAETGNYNAQVEQYRQEVLGFESRLDGIEAIIPSTAFDSVNTVDKRFDDMDTTIGGITGSINDVSDEVEKNFKSLILHEIDFECVDRYIVGPSGAINGTAQAGCAFEQNDILYYAQFIQATDSTNDKLIIRDLETGATVASVTDDFGHGYSMSYNPDTKQLLTHTDDNKLLLISTETISAPYIQEYVDLSIFGLTVISGGMFCWFGDDYAYIRFDQKTITVLDTATHNMTVHNVNFDNTSMPQNINYHADSNSFYIGASSPNCIIVVDAETFTQTHVINVTKPFYGCVFVRELESTTRLGNVIYFNNYEVVDGQLVVSLFACDLEHGSVSSDLHQIMSDVTGNIAAIVDYESGSLIPNAYHTAFKLAGDALKAAQAIGAYGRVFLNFKSDYPFTIWVEGGEAAIQKLSSVVGSVHIKSIVVASGDLVVVPQGLIFDPIYTQGSYNCAIHAYMSKLIINQDTAITLEGTYANPVMINAESSEVFMLRNTTSNVLSLRTLYSVINAYSNECYNSVADSRSVFNTVA